MDITPASFAKSFSQFLHRFHVTIFVVIVLGAVGAAVWVNYLNIIAADNTENYTPQTNSITFDEATRQRLADMETADYRLGPGANAPRELPTGGRTNPFVE